MGAFLSALIGFSHIDATSIIIGSKDLYQFMHIFHGGILSLIVSLHEKFKLSLPSFFNPLEGIGRDEFKLDANDSRR